MSANADRPWQPSAAAVRGRHPRWAAAGGHPRPRRQARLYNFFNFLIKNQFSIKRSKTLIELN
jgi:hypothetical protein